MSRVKILVVEDEGVVAEDIQVSLGELGYDVVAVAKSGEEAIRKALGEAPDLILMDIHLHGDMDGIEAAQRINETLRIPIVYLTAFSDDEMLERARVAEPFGYLIKPYRERELHSTIEMALFKHQLESELRENREWLSVTLKSIGDGVVATDRLGFVKFMNPMAEHLTGWSENNARGRLLAAVLDVRDEKNGSKLNDFVESLAGGRSRRDARHSHVLFAKDGTRRNIEAGASPIRDSEHVMIGTVLVFRDVTDRKRAEERLWLLSEAVSQSSEGIGLAAMDGTILFANKSLAALHGYQPEEVIGRRLSIFHNEAQLPHFKEADSALRSQGRFSGEIWHARSDGSVFPGLVHNSLVVDRDSEPIGIIQTLRDITDIKETEEALIKSHEALEAYSSSLEAKVEERTKDLERSREQLRAYSESLEKTNKALKIIIESVEEQRKEVENKITHNLNLTVKPILDQLRSQEKSETVEFLLHSLEFNLTNMFSSFGINIVRNSHMLTPREIRICEMIRSGLSSKQIAKVMDISPQTVLVHRKNIRKKLDLARSRRNLASFLRSSPF